MSENHRKRDSVIVSRFGEQGAERISSVDVTARRPSNGNGRTLSPGRPREMEHPGSLPSSTTGLRKISLLGNHLPRQCGIATFTTHLNDAITAAFPGMECFVMAMNDSDRSYVYPSQVRYQLPAANLPAYQRAADFLNVGDVNLVCVQHEYGIFGGQAGSHVLALLRDLRMPIVTTLHTILADPNPFQRIAMDELTKLSERLIVMSAGGASLLRDVHKVPESKIDIIPHGIPSLPDAGQSKAQLGVEGKMVILTFGLLSPGKGIEHVIDSLPSILERHPQTLYIVVGATHPHTKRTDGETYRVMLENRAQKLGVDGAIVFYNRFLSQDELNQFLSAADIYITPYLNPEQITSGTLAYALGSGKAVISTPYSYARELLSDDRGILIPWPKDDPRAIARAVSSIIGDDARRAMFRERGIAYGRNMLWPSVARSYVKSFDQARIEHGARLRLAFRARTLADRPLGLPEVNFDHLCQLTDDTGILQHAVFDVPNYDHGYCLDDNARALLLATLVDNAGNGGDRRVRSFASRYLAFVIHAFDASRGRFRNFMSYARQWIEPSVSDDSQGRALWALGFVIGHSNRPGRSSLSRTLFCSALPGIKTCTSPRAWAYALLGIDGYLRAFGGDRDVLAVRTQLAMKLLGLYQRTSTREWPWFEEKATYCNARLSQALLVCGERMEHHEMKRAGLRSMEWLSEIQTLPSENGWFAPIGSNGFYERGGCKASFDQQPVEVHAMVSACLTARRITGDGHWERRARNAFNWFLGDNQLRQPIYDSSTGGCRDGLYPDRPNENQGAESTLSFLMALLELKTCTQDRASVVAERMPSDEKEILS